jgi:hypothetical protein
MVVTFSKVRSSIAPSSTACRRRGRLQRWRLEGTRPLAHPASPAQITGRCDLWDSPDAPKRPALEAYLPGKVKEEAHAVGLHTINSSQRILRSHGPSLSNAIHPTDGSRPVMLSQNTVFGMDSGSHLACNWSRSRGMPRNLPLLRQEHTRRGRIIPPRRLGNAGRRQPVRLPASTSAASRGPAETPACSWTHHVQAHAP